MVMLLGKMEIQKEDISLGAPFIWPCACGKKLSILLKKKKKKKKKKGNMTLHHILLIGNGHVTCCKG